MRLKGVEFLHPAGAVEPVRRPPWASDPRGGRPLPAELRRRPARLQEIEFARAARKRGGASHSPSSAFEQNESGLVRRHYTVIATTTKTTTLKQTSEYNWKRK